LFNLFVCLFYVLDLQDQLREELEMDPNLPAVLLMGGGEGMGPVKKTALALAESLFDKELGKPIGQLIIICGRNKTLVSTLENEQWKIPVKVMAFLNLSVPRQYLHFEHPLNAFSSLM
jgi:UDP-N-acetylglucosamine:LPS N-acetylglucosamine transferase